MVKPDADQETETRKVFTVLLSVTPWGKDSTPCRATGESTEVSHEAESEGEALGRDLYCGIRGKEWARQGRQP